MYNIDIVQKGVTENAVLRLMFHDCVRYTGGFVSFTTLTCTQCYVLFFWKRNQSIKSCLMLGDILSMITDDFYILAIT